ncbi:MAG TPA: hypothetical protein PJ982_18020, partial [Lacipirellulaceae bacterium]|nr:hypothetical protein [Lacipirellulaceae bacterium]
SGWDFNGNGWDTQSRLNIPSNVTIAGQTAPGPVILMGGVVKPQGDNIVLRNVIIAPGYGSRNFNDPSKPAPQPAPGTFPDSYVYDAIDISGTNVMIDHVTTVYATDETISVNEQSNNVTVQYSNISLGQNYPQADAEGGGSYTGHSFGSLLQAGSNARISFHHNLYAHQKGRLPRVGTPTNRLTIPGVGPYNDFRNNVFYNWLGTAGSGASNQLSQNNFVGNYYLAGPGGDNPIGGSNPGITTASGGTGIFNGSNSSGTKVFHSGNVKDTNKNGVPEFLTGLTNSDFGSSSFQANAQWHGGAPTYFGVTDTAAAAFDRVLDYVGATWWDRHPVDQRLVHEVRTGTGKIMAWADDPFNHDASEGAEWRAMVGTPMTSRSPNWDTSGDGIPDWWAIAHGLNPSVANNNGDFDNDGYTNLEEYLNELAAWPAPGPIVFSGATNMRYAQATNWDANPDPAFTHSWQPSRFDVAEIRSGAATVDAVGQHAGLLRIAPGAGQSAALNVTSGWIQLAAGLEVGAGGAGTVNHSEGVVATPEVILGGGAVNYGSYNLSGTAVLRVGVLHKATPNEGEFNMTGGVLSAEVVTFDLVNTGGVISPGGSIGQTHVQGDLINQAGAGLLEITGVVPGSFVPISIAARESAGWVSAASRRPIRLVLFWLGFWPVRPATS